MDHLGSLRDSELSSLYRVFVEGKEIPVHFCRVSAVPYNTCWPGRQRSLDQTEEAAFVSFAAEKQAALEVEIQEETGKGDLRDADITVRPLKKAVHAAAPDHNRVRLTVPGPGFYTLETNGPSKCLHIFVDSPETLKLDEAGKTATYRFEKGVFDAGTIRLRSGESLYIGEDAVVYGTVEADDAENVRIFGRGVLDGSREERTDGSCLKYGTLHIRNCENVIVSGIIFRDSSCWTATVIKSKNVTFKNVKAVGMWRYNTDGIDLVNSQNCTVEDCFLRTFDDGAVLKGLKAYDDENMENISVRGCVLWCDWGRALEIGAETCADRYENIVFEDCDIIHGDCILMDIQNGDRASVRGVTFRNIRCEYSKYQKKPVYQQDMSVPYPEGGDIFVPVLFKAHLYCGLWSDDMIFGENRDILLENIEILKDFCIAVPEIVLEGADEDHRTYNVRLADIRLNGEKMQASDVNVKLGKFADFPEII